MSFHPRAWCVVVRCSQVGSACDLTACALLCDTWGAMWCILVSWCVATGASWNLMTLHLCIVCGGAMLPT